MKAAIQVYDPAVVNDAAFSGPIGPDTSGSSTVRIQILLDRTHFSPGEIDGHFGKNTENAVAHYQTARQLPVTRVVDEATWASLNADTAPPLVEYEVTPEEAASPFQAIPKAMEEQAQLDYLGYQSLAEELGEKFHIDPALLAKLNPGTELQAGARIAVPNVQREYGVVQAWQVRVSKDQQTVTALAEDGTILAQYPATIGSDHDPLPIGNWKVTVVQHDPVFNYNPDLFWDSDAKDAKARVAPGPNNPVGLVWIGLSKEHYGIHGTPDPGTIGHTESHGCIRLTNWDAKELSFMVKPGTPVILEEY